MRDSTAKKLVSKSRNALFVTLATLAVLGVSFFGWVYKAKTRRELSIQLLGAVRNNDTEAVKSLLARAADPNSSESMEKQQSVWQQLEHIAKGGDQLTTQPTRLVSSGPWWGVQLPPCKQNFSALELAVYRESENIPLIEALLNARANADGQSEDHLTPLMYAVLRGRLKTVQALLAHGANPIARDAIGRFPVHYVSNRENQAEVLDLLLKQGNNVDAVDSENITPLMSRRTYIRDNTGTARWLIAKGANVNARSKGGGSALLMATTMSNTKAIRLLLEHGAEVNVHDKDSNTPLSNSIQHGSLSDIKLLLAHGAKADPIDKDGDTPLTTSLKAGNSPDCVKALIEAGADVNHRNKLGDTALSLARKRQNQPSVRLLEAAGAKR